MQFYLKIAVPSLKHWLIGHASKIAHLLGLTAPAQHTAATTLHITTTKRKTQEYLSIGLDQARR